MTATPVITLRAGAFLEAVGLLLRDAADTGDEVSTVLTAVQGPAPAPGDPEEGASLLAVAAMRAHVQTPPMHIVSLRYEQLITPTDVRALRAGYPDSGSPEVAAEWTAAIDSTEQDLRDHPDHYALAVVLVSRPCPHYREAHRP